jgi:hypothetical protein
MRADRAYPVAYPIASSKEGELTAHLTCSAHYGCQLRAPTVWAFPDSHLTGENKRRVGDEVEMQQTLRGRTTVVCSRRSLASGRPIVSLKNALSSPVQLFVLVPTDSGGRP